MTDIALFHSVLGVRPGVENAADTLRAFGYRVRVVDQYAGRVFDDYAEASAYVETIGGYPALMASAAAAVADLPAGFACLGFSNGGGMATYVATRLPVSRVVLCSGALPLSVIGVESWPAGVSTQLHYARDDPFRTVGHVEEVADSVTAAGGRAEAFFYPGKGHLFTDASLPGEYDAAATELLWQRVHRFLTSAT